MSEYARRPTAIGIAVVANLLIALAFLTIPLLGLVYGDDVQTAAEQEVVAQGLPVSVLADNELSFRESGVAIVFPVVIALGIALLGWWLRTGRPAARIVSLIVMPVVILANVAILISNASAVSALQTMFDRSNDADLRRLDAQALFDAALGAYPDWLPVLTSTRNTVVFGCAVLVIVLLLAPSARAYFRSAKQPATTPA
ncbi:hypothetical protein HDA40_005559 [Hamadaea flava]|uniref:DUF1772 domain-containing protein n=1 Tax=Hamadaea flava TaxID=1742688 RepID=A0ABV8LQX5_9ACTN|nr:hypothetical protein [Hamadaea flava]MCP2327052.1 hypothetical protein [Hamadaea flava]